MKAGPRRMPKDAGPQAPAHLESATAAWWLSVVTTWELDEHHVRLLTLASEAFDRAVAARARPGCGPTARGAATASADTHVRCIMPRLRRIPRVVIESGVRAQLSGAELFDLLLGERDAFADDADRQANWERHREAVLRRCQLTHRPHAFWAYEPDVPEDCRPDALDALLESDQPPDEGTIPDDWQRELGGHARETRARGALARRRRAWLVGAGAHHLREG